MSETNAADAEPEPPRKPDRPAAGPSRKLPVSRGGMDVSGGANYPVRSVFDLVGVTVSTSVNGVATEISSPWTATAEGVDAYLADLLERVGTSNRLRIIGRININRAPREVLAGLPGLDEEHVRAILAGRTTLSGAPADIETGPHRTPGWLLSQRILSLRQLRDIGPWITTRGDVFSLQVFADFHGHWHFRRIEALLDATRKPARIAATRDLTPLGRGFSSETLESAGTE